jgi:hypothetical protein
VSTTVTTDQADAEPSPAGRRRAGAILSGRLATTLTDYRAALESADLSANARRGYGSRVAGFLDWLATGPDLDGDPLTLPAARDDAVLDYRSWLKTVRKATPWTVNAHLTDPDAGKSRVHPHTLRHTFGTQLLRNGVDIVIVADLMGHATLDTTRSYTKSSETDRARAIEDALISDE